VKTCTNVVVLGVRRHRGCTSLERGLHDIAHGSEVSARSGVPQLLKYVAEVIGEKLFQDVKAVAAAAQRLRK
jgi:hypothetical protein